MRRKSFYVLMPRATFGTEHQVYAKLKPRRNGSKWTMKPQLTGRTIASARSKPNDLTSITVSHTMATELEQRSVEKGEAESGVQTYLHAYVCAAPAPRHEWHYGVVVACSWHRARGARLVMQTDRDQLRVAVPEFTLHAVNLAGYALRPFDHLPMVTDLDAFKATTNQLVARFHSHDRHWPLDVSALPLDCSSWTQPPNTMRLWCIDERQKKVAMTVKDILDFAHAQYQTLGKEVARCLTAHASTKRPRSISDDAGLEFRAKWVHLQCTLTYADVPDLEAASVGSTLKMGMLACILSGDNNIPPAVFVRKEMRMLWDLLLVNYTADYVNAKAPASVLLSALREYNVPSFPWDSSLSSDSDDENDVDAEQHCPLRLRLVLLGSSGVGKSVLVLLFCAYLAVYHEYHILLARAGTTDLTSDIITWFRGVHVTTHTLSNRSDLAPLVTAFLSENEGRTRKFLIVADDYSLWTVRYEALLAPFRNRHVLLVSRPHDMPDPDAAFFAMSGDAAFFTTPGWGRVRPYRSNVRTVLVLPAWSKEALRQAHATDTAVVDTFDERYAYSGGNLRLFGTAPELHPLGMQALGCTESTPVTYQYVKDVVKYKHYVVYDLNEDVVDARVLLRRLISTMPAKRFAAMLEWTETSTNASLHSLHFEALIHKLASDGMLQLSIVPLLPLVVAVRGKMVSRGETRVACLAYLATALGDGTYWLPHGTASFDAVDAIFVQDRCVYYLKTAVDQEEMSIDWALLLTMHAAVTTNPYVAGYEHVFVLATPPGKQWRGDKARSQIRELCVWHAAVLKTPDSANLLSLR